MNKDFKTDLKEKVETGIKRGIVFTVWYNVKGIPCVLLSEKKLSKTSLEILESFHAISCKYTCIIILKCIEVYEESRT